MIDNKEYKINTLDDIANLPDEDCVNRCIDEMREVILIQHKLSLKLKNIPIVGRLFKTKAKYTWINDGKNNTEISIKND